MLVMSFQLPTIQRFYGKVLGKTSAANEYAASARKSLFTPAELKRKSPQSDISTYIDA